MRLEIFMKHKICIFVFVVTAFVNTLAWAHGESELGPNGGYIQMPSNFHTEVKANGAKSFDVYLLDLQFKNATVENSEVKASVKSKAGQETLKCEPVEGTHFMCTGQKEHKSGQLVITAKRLGIQAVPARYKLPFALTPMSHH